jgi:hypothetical protein
MRICPVLSNRLGRFSERLLSDHLPLPPNCFLSLQPPHNLPSRTLHYSSFVNTSFRRTDALRKIYRTEGVRGLYKGSLLALVGVSNGSIQFATYEAIKRRWTDAKRRLYEGQGRAWRVEDEKLVRLIMIETVIFELNVITVKRRIYTRFRGVEARSDSLDIPVSSCKS